MKVLSLFLFFIFSMSAFSSSNDYEKFSGTAEGILQRNDRRERIFSIEIKTKISIREWGEGKYNIGINYSTKSKRRCPFKLSDSLVGIENGFGQIILYPSSNEISDKSTVGNITHLGDKIILKLNKEYTLVSKGRLSFLENARLRPVCEVGIPSQTIELN